MKKLILTVVVLIAVFASGFGLGTWFGKSKPVHPISVTHDNSRPPMTHEGSMPTQAEWQELRTTRDKTLQNDPALSAEYQALKDQIAAQERDVQAAMIKSDPKVGPLLARLAAIRHPAPSSISAGPKPLNAHE